MQGESFSSDDILVFREAKEGTETVSNRFISIDLDCLLNDDLIAEGLAREVVNRVQKTRKEINLNVTDRIKVSYSGSEDICNAIETHLDHIQHETLADVFIRQESAAPDFTFKIDEFELQLNIEKR